MRLDLFAVLGGAVLIASCQSPDNKVAEDSNLADGNRLAEFIERARTEAARDLRDPSSAQFRDLQISKIDDRGVLCGEINAKNAYGAYAGFTGFYAVEKSDGTINASVADDGWTTERGLRCFKEWEERRDPNDPSSATVERELADIGCGTMDYDFMFWGGRSIFCKNPVPVEEGAGPN